MVGGGRWKWVVGGGRWKWVVGGCRWKWLVGGCRWKSEDYQRGWISPLYVRGVGEGRRDMQKIFRGGGSVQAMIHGRCCHFMVERTSHSTPILVCVTDRKLLGSSTLTTNDT